MIRFRVRLPLVGDQTHAPIGCGTAKTKTFLRRKTQDQVGGPERLPLVGPGQTKNHQKGDPTHANLPAGFQAHPSMRICSAAVFQTAFSPREALNVLSYCGAHTHAPH
jgi:hypothetical protein